MDKNNLKICDCGSVFFYERKAVTYFDSKFSIVGNTRDKLETQNSTIQFAECMICHRIHLPVTSFSGKNYLDEMVKVYEELIHVANTINSNIEDSESNVKTTDDSKECLKDDVQQHSHRGRPKQNIKQPDI